MASTFATASTVVGLGSSSLSSPKTKTTTLSSGFLKSSVSVRNPLKQARASALREIGCEGISM
uniref:Uncharacterized protein n=1 Tax=Cannabis sativa TaxID=3483 RepID=A0A803R3G0_CANSA